MSSRPPSIRWSQCSKYQLLKSFDEELDYCLHNIPQAIYDYSPECGNGIIDSGEDCDCGNAPTWVRSLSYTFIMIVVVVIVITVVKSSIHLAKIHL